VSGAGLRGEPQWLQNSDPATTSVWQFEHFIRLNPRVPFPRLVEKTGSANRPTERQVTRTDRRNYVMIAREVTYGPLRLFEACL